MCRIPWHLAVKFKVQPPESPSLWKTVKRLTHTENLKKSSLQSQACTHCQIWKQWSISHHRILLRYLMQQRTTSRVLISCGNSSQCKKMDLNKLGMVTLCTEKRKERVWVQRWSWWTWIFYSFSTARGQVVYSLACQCLPGHARVTCFPRFLILSIKHVWYYPTTSMLLSCSPVVQVKGPLLSCCLIRLFSATVDPLRLVLM